MADQQAPNIDPEGIRDGQPEALVELVDTCGPSVLGFCLELGGSDRAAIAAAEAFARFRSALVTLGEDAAVQPEVLLLAATRHAGTGAADLDLLWASARIQDRDPPCEMIPTMLAARATGQLTDADLERVAKHLWRCEGCRLVEAAFNRAEAAYGDPTTFPEEHEAQLMFASLLAAAPVAEDFEEPAPVVPEDEPGEDEPPVDEQDDADEPENPDILGDVEPAGFLDDADFDPRARPTVLFDALAPEDDELGDEDSHPEAEWASDDHHDDSDEVEAPRRRSATFVFSLLALVAVVAALGAAVAIEGLPGQNDVPKTTTPATTQTLPADPTPTIPATR